MLSRFDVFITVFRSFFLQAVFNFEGYQNIGFVFSLLWIIKKHISDVSELRKIMIRHLEIFNTQPYMSGFVIGNVARMEIDKKDEKDIIKVKQSLASSFASIGDRIFWARMRCIEAYTTVLLTVIFYYLCHNDFETWGMWIAASLPTLFYFAYTLYIRYIGIIYGFKCGGIKNCGLDRFDWNQMIRRLSRISFFLGVVSVIVIVFVYGFFLFSKSISHNAVYISIPFLSFASQRFFRKDRKNILYPIGVMMIICFILCFLRIEI
ncbi:MAG: PTS system mannose/fructose/sorbose family transporter subunit IID [Elusimicrobiales bacterium]